MVRALSLLAGASVAAAIVGCAASPGGGRLPETVTVPDGTRFAVETVIDGLDTVWDLIRAPDGSIWFSERAGRVSRLEPASGSRTLVGEVSGVLESGEAGLMGIALHPDFPAVPILYAAHSYDTGGGIGNRLVRMRYENGSLGPPEILLDGLAGRRNHDGSRIVFGPDGLLYMTTGDAGNRPASQDARSLSGKILRLTADGGPAPGNPFGDRIWSLGHRNPQGLFFHPEGMLYSTEHGAGDEDELNLIEPGGNYGWPALEGFCNTRGEEPWCAANDAVEPLWVWSPTVGIAGADLYAGDAVAGWEGDILAVSLRGASLYRVRLSADGRRAVSGETLLAGAFGRLRDVLVGPGGEIYLATSNRDGRGRPSRGDDRILRLTPR